MFVDHIDKTIEVYVENMLIKSKKENQYVAELTKVFKILDVYKTKLNFAKCAFDVSLRTILGFMVSH